MKLIDIFNKIANGEKVPKKIKFASTVFEYDENEAMYYADFKNICDYVYLDDEVEIIEEEKEIPEKIKDKYSSQISKVELAQKYNEIIDYLKYLKSKGDE